MRISVAYSTGRTETSVTRALDGQRRRLIISCPWGQPPARTVAAVWNQLTAEEQAEVAQAFGLHGAIVTTPPEGSA